MVPTRINPLAGDPDGAWRATWHRAEPPVDPLIRAPLAAGRTPRLDLRFQGLRNPWAFEGAAPPDTVGDVGPNHYVQAVNRTKVAVFDKHGHLLASPFDLADLWPDGPCARDIGDPMVLFDRMADRWLLSQLSLSLPGGCVAISETGDPLGGYFLYDFELGGYPDYLKFGVWADSYLATGSEGTYTAYAFDRAKMLAGDPSAGFIKFTGVTNFMLPADIDGPTPPPVVTMLRGFVVYGHPFEGLHDQLAERLSRHLHASRGGAGCGRMMSNRSSGCGHPLGIERRTCMRILTGGSQIHGGRR